MVGLYEHDSEISNSIKSRISGHTVAQLRYYATSRKVAGSIPDCPENVGASTSHNPMGLHSLLQGYSYPFFTYFMSKEPYLAPNRNVLMALG
jgi:hypothetical protein